MSKEIYGLDIGAVYMVLTRGIIKNSNFIGDVLRTSTDLRLIPTIQVFENIKYLFGQTAQKSCIRDYKTTIQLVKDSFKNCDKNDIVKPEQFNYHKRTGNGKDKEYYSVYHNKLLTYTPEDFYTSLLYEAKAIMKERHTNPDEIKYEDYTYVLSYPPYYTQEQITSLKTIAQRSFHRDNEKDKIFDDIETIPKIDDVHVIPEYVAAAVAYGYENNSSFNGKKNIVIIDIGYYCCYCVNCVYERGKCTINNKECRCDISGSIIDQRIVDYFKEKIKTEEGKDKFSEKDIIKLRIEISKIKEKLSAAGADAVQISVDGILEDDEDYSGEFSVEKLNEIIKDLPDKLIELLIKTVGNKEDLKNYYDVVIIGGSLRIPLFQNRLENEIHHLLIRTLNMDESIAYGCIYYGAMVKGIWKYEINEIDGEKITKELSLLSGRWKSIKHKMDVVYLQEKEANEAAKMRNSIEKKIYELQHKIIEPNEKYEEFCTKLLGLLKLRGFVYLPSKMLKLYEEEIDNVTKEFDKNTDFKTVETSIIYPTEAKQKSDIESLLHLDDSDVKGIEEFLSILQNRNEEEANSVKDVLNRMEKQPQSKYEVGDIKKYYFPLTDEAVVIIVGKEYDIKASKWTYEIETVDSVMSYRQVYEEELKELSYDNRKAIDNCYLGKMMNGGEEIVDVFETGFITTKNKSKKRYLEYFKPLE